MPGISDLFGRHGAIEQLFLWSILAEVIGAEFAPFLTALRQDVSSAHPLVALPAELAADAVARKLLTHPNGVAEAAKYGIDPGRFDTMVRRATVRIPPGDLATAVLRSYLTLGQAQAEAEPQGITAAQLGTLIDLAGDAPGPQQLAEALRRRIIPAAGRGRASVSFEQGIAESRLHDKWGTVLEQLSAVLLSPPEAASAVVRNFMAEPAAAEVAQRQGVDAATFAIMRDLAADAPGPQQLAEALRRGLIPEAGSGAGSVSFAQGIAEGRLADKWAPVIRGLAQLWPTPVDALDAAVKGQLTSEQGRQLYERLGGDPEFYSWLLASIGNSPTPLEAAMMAARGIITEHGTGPDVLSYDQAVKESRYRDKWGGAYREVSRHLPPPSTVVTLLAHRQISHDKAAQLLAQNDVAPDVIEAYLGEAQYTAISDYRGLTQGAVVDMYYAHLISHDLAVEILGVLHVTQAAAELLLSYADMRQVIDSIQRSVQRIAGLFTGRKIGVQTATDALARLGIPAASVSDILATWELQAAANVKTLTQAQIIDAWYYKVMDQGEAIDALTAIGYTDYDAWVLLSNKAKGALPGKPARVVAPPPGAVIPGVT